MKRGCVEFGQRQSPFGNFARLELFLLVVVVVFVCVWCVFVCVFLFFFLIVSRLPCCSFRQQHEEILLGASFRQQAGITL